MDRLESIINKANEQGRIAVIPFLTAGFPDRDNFWKILHALDESGVDIIEIGVPFSDPVADGPVIEAASRKVLYDGVTLKALLQKLQSHTFRAGIVLMGYMNPFLQYGFETLIKDSKKSGVNGFIIPDLPYEEYGNLRTLMQKENIALIPLVGPNTSKERMRLYAKHAQGYVYVVSVLGITGERNKISKEISDIIGQAKEIFNVPVALGFGLKHPSQLDELSVQPNAAVFGSAFILHVEAGKSVEEFIAPWLNARLTLRT